MKFPSAWLRNEFKYKSWWYHAAKNAQISGKVASNILGGSSGLGSIARYAAVGAGLGAIRGAGDNIIGEDRVSVLGGAMQGAITLGGLRAMKVGANRLGRGKAASISKNVSSGGAAAGGAASFGPTPRTVVQPGNPMAGTGSRTSVRRGRGRVMNQGSPLSG
jgi:hypothetical protein